MAETQAQSKGPNRRKKTNGKPSESDSDISPSASFSNDFKQGLTSYIDILGNHIKETQEMHNAAKIMLNFVDLFTDVLEENEQLRMKNKEYSMTFKRLHEICQLQSKKDKSSNINKRTRTKSLLEPPKKRRRKNKT